MRRDFPRIFDVAPNRRLTNFRSRSGLTSGFQSSLMIRIAFFLSLLLASQASFAQLNKNLRDNVVRRGGVQGQTPVTFMTIVDAGGRTLSSGGKESRKNHIKINAFSQKSYVSADEETGAIGSDVVHGTVKITRTVDEASMELMEALDNNSILKKVELIVYNDAGSPDPDGERYKVRLDDVRILSISTSMNTGNSRLATPPVLKEEIVLSYGQISWSVNDGVSSYHTDVKP